MWPLIRLLPREFHFNFVRLAPYAAIFSAILIALSGVMFVYSRRNRVDHRNVNDDWVEDVTDRQIPVRTH